jgi:ankyrin repeat protein
MADIWTSIREGNDTELLKLLEKDPTIINARESLQVTPLHKAATYGRDSTVSILIQKGADINAKDGNYNKTPLHEAASAGNDSIVSLLLHNGADIHARYTLTIRQRKSKRGDTMEISIQYVRWRLYWRLYWRL